MTINIKKLTVIFFAVSVLASCAKKSEDRTARGSGPALGVAGNTSTCGTGQQSVGRIYEANNIDSTSTFEQRVKGLISATVDPQYFGTISGNGNDAQSGVTIEGRLRYDGNGSVLLDQSNLKITIYDSYVGQKDSSGNAVQAYPINFNTASAGTMNLQTKVFTLQFKDTYGEVTLNGTVNASTVTGTVSYQNYTSYKGGQAAAGNLGTFTIATCGLVN